MPNAPIKDAYGVVVPVSVDTAAQTGESVQRVIPIPDQIVTGSLTAVGSVTATPRAGDTTFTVDLSGTFAGTVTFEALFNGTWRTISVVNITNAAPVTTATAAGTFEGAIPAGCTGVRARVSTYTSGTWVIAVSTSQSQYEPVVTLGGGTLSSLPALAAGTAQVGHIRAGGVWYDDTSTALGAGGTFTTTARDLGGSATGVQWVGNTNVNNGNSEVRFSATADVVGTLYLEISRDNTTFRRVRRVVLTQEEAGLAFFGEIRYFPSTRYVRAHFINGAGAQTYFMLQSFLMSN